MKHIFYIWMSIFFPAPFVEHYPFSTKLPLHHQQNEAVHISVDLFLDSPFCFIDLFIYLATNITTLPWLLQLYNKCLNQLASYPTLFFFCFSGYFGSIRFLHFLGNFRINLSISPKTMSARSLFETALNLWISWGEVI